MSILDQANNPRRLVSHNDDSDMSSSAYPYATLLGGIRCWVQRDRLSLPLYGLMVSRYRRERASPRHLGARNLTYTEIKLSETALVYAPHP